MRRESRVSAHSGDDRFCSRIPWVNGSRGTQVGRPSAAHNPNLFTADLRERTEVGRERACGFLASPYSSILLIDPIAVLSEKDKQSHGAVLGVIDTQLLR
jgi:hypothetical protein